MTRCANLLTSRAQPTPTRQSIPSGKLPALLALLGQAGINGQEVMLACGIDPGLERMPDARLPLAAWVELNREAASLLGDPDLGLHQGERCTGLPTMLGYLLTACGTLGESLHIFQRYQGLEHEGFELLKHRTGRSIELEYVPHVPLAQDRLLIDYSLAGIVGHIRQLTGLPAVVQEVQFTYAHPSGVSEHHRIFQSPIRFSSNRNLIRFDESVLDHALLRANPDVYHQLEQPLRRALRALKEEEPVSARVAQILGRTMNDAGQGIQQVAKHLGLGTRRLQADLQEEGTTFRQLRESVRQSLALEYLADSAITLQEITFLLGYSEPSAFHRAFRRWTGKTPAESRAWAISMSQS